jgi:hypothetical protein
MIEYMTGSCGARSLVEPTLLHGPNLTTLSATAESWGLAFGPSLTQLYTVAIGSVYPDTITEIPGVIPFVWQYKQRVLVSEFANGAENRRLSWQSPRKDVMISYHYLIREEAQQLYDFYQRQEGPLKSFAFFFPNPQSYEREYCGTYTGVKDINLPSKVSNGGVGRILYNGNTILSGSQYDFYEHSGDTGCDKATLRATYTPAIGSKFYFSFVGRLKIKARFSDSPIQVGEIKDRFSSFSVELIGLEASFI